MLHLPVKTIHPYTNAGLFGAVRKHDIHTGVDLYCDEGANVYSISYGEVIDVSPFTGEWAGSPWWNETSVVAIRNLGNDHVIVYGEVEPIVHVGQSVSSGQLIATVKKVLKKDKGINPTSMLHLEVWTKNYQSNFTWYHNNPKPEGLINPLSMFPFWVLKTPSGYRIETYSGHYMRYFASAVDCKAYCMWRTDEFDERYIYVKSTIDKLTYHDATGKTLENRL